MQQNKEAEGLDLLAYLILPVQRILRYKLLLEVKKKQKIQEKSKKKDLIYSGIF